MKRTERFEVARADVPLARVELAPLEVALACVGEGGEEYFTGDGSLGRNGGDEDVRPEEELFVELERLWVVRMEPEERLWRVRGKSKGGGMYGWGKGRTLRIGQPFR